MKKLMMTGAVLACAASIVSAQTVTSANMVGYAKVTAVGGELTLVALNFTPTSTEVSDLIGDQLPAASSLHIWDKGAGVYNTVSKAARGGWPAGATIELGQAFWIQASGTASNEVILSGEVLLAETNSTTIAVGIDATGYYYPVATLFGDTDLSVQLPSASTIHVWDEVTQSYATHSKAARGGWSTAANSTVIGPGTGFWVQTTGGLSWDEVRPFTP